MGNKLQAKKALDIYILSNKAKIDRVMILLTFFSSFIVL